ncbi:MAG TPA: response regulator [Candidatus Sulfotelmatobacter sp.]|nr:response regulator [Candidatus Sulfotelmatobacter sp.]
MALILVIDDDPALRQLMRRILSDAGHSVVEAENGAVGVKCARQHRPTIAITDILMPEKEGIETIRELRRLQLGVKIIAMSGGTSAKGMLYLDAAKTLGADATLLKPFRRADLLVAVNDLLTRG